MWAGEEGGVCPIIIGYMHKGEYVFTKIIGCFHEKRRKNFSEQKPNATFVGK
jgi:hypothetical protein